MHEVPFAFVSHKSGDRIRLKVPSRKKDHDYFRGLQESLPLVSGVRSVQTNPMTASVLLTHSSDPDHLIQQLTAKEGLFRLEHGAFTQARLQRRISETFRGFDVALRDMSGNEIDLGGTAFLALLGASAYQLIKGNITAIPWYTAGWYALNLFLKSGSGQKPDR